jgi:hypothetical protein
MADLAADLRDATSVLSIPNDILDHHLFSYFQFRTRVGILGCVCKHWNKVCKNSTIVPRQLSLTVGIEFDMGGSIMAAQTFRPTSLHLRLFNEDYRFAIAKIVTASNFMDTAIYPDRCQQTLI